MSVVEFSFWFSLFMVFYAYAGYPMVLRMLSLSQGGGNRAAGGYGSGVQLPTVSLLISAYNEEAVIDKKLENALSLDYPRERLEIVVISDGSTDRTNEIVSRYAGKGVLLRHYEGRIGKTACLNRTVPLAAGDVIVFSDANSLYNRDSLREMTRHFRDPGIGCVTGWTKYLSGKKEDTGSLGIYARLELLTKKFESRIGSSVGADGAIFAIRKKLYQPLEPHDINDFIIPLTVVEQGYRAVLEEKAFCFETSAGSARGEFQRQVRITNRTIRALVNKRRLLNPVRFGIFSFELFSHKACRFLVPLFLIVLLISGLALAGRSSLYLAAFVAQAVFYIAAASAGRVPYLSGVLAAAHAFVMVNCAVLLAWIRYFQGVTYTTWSPTQR